MDGRLQLVETGSGCRDGRMCRGQPSRAERKLAARGIPS